MTFTRAFGVEESCLFFVEAFRASGLFIETRRQVQTNCPYKKFYVLYAPNT